MAFPRLLHVAHPTLVAALAASCATTPVTAPARSLAEMTERVVVVDGTTIRYRTHGASAKPVVLIHGWACSMEFWQHQITDLTPGRQVVAIDLPGHGSSDAPQIEYTLPNFARAVLAMLDAEGIEAAVLVGHSMGTAVALNVLRQAPARVAGIVAVDGALRVPAMAAEQRGQFLAQFRGPNYRDALRSMFGQPAPKSSAAKTDWIIEHALQTPQHVMVSAMQGMFDDSAWSTEPIRCPLAILDAQAPFWTDEYQAFVRRLAPQVRWRTFTGVSHFLMIDAPAEFNPVLLAELRAMGA